MVTHPLDARFKDCSANLIKYGCMEVFMFCIQMSIVRQVFIEKCILIRMNFAIVFSFKIANVIQILDSVCHLLSHKQPSCLQSYSLSYPGKSASQTHRCHKLWQIEPNMHHGMMYWLQFDRDGVGLLSREIYFRYHCRHFGENTGKRAQGEKNKDLRYGPVTVLCDVNQDDGNMFVKKNQSYPRFFNCFSDHI